MASSEDKTKIKKYRIALNKWNKTHSKEAFNELEKASRAVDVINCSFYDLYPERKPKNK